MKHSAKLLITGLLAVLPMASWSQGPDDDEPVDCIRLTLVDRTEIIDERRIAFHMRGGDIYVNNLDHACPDLERGRPFSYESRNGRLCSVDAITILETFGIGLSRGATCRLGMFAPTSEDMLAILTGEEEPGDVTVVPVEVDPTALPAETETEAEAEQ